MNKLIEECLYVKNRSRFYTLKKEASNFRSKYIGNTIVRDSIFDILFNYAKVNEHHLKILKFPIEDKELWAFTCIKEGIVFVTINTALPLNNQIFAAAHELYHIYRYISKAKEDYIEKGSILTEETVDELKLSEEDREANAFAALILAPKEQIRMQISLSGRAFTDSDLYDLIHFMNYFAMPYKAMVLKLFECKRYNQEQADILLKSENREIMEEAYIHDCGTQWLKPTNENNFSTIKALIKLNRDLYNITESRATEDIAFLDKLKQDFKSE